MRRRSQKLFIAFLLIAFSGCTQKDPVRPDPPPPTPPEVADPVDDPVPRPYLCRPHRALLKWESKRP